MNDLTGAVARTRARLAHGDSCHEHVMRGGRGEPCDKPAVALRDDTEADSYYPVCVRHARGFCIPIVDRFDLLTLLDALDAAEAAVQRVRELHQPCDSDRDRTPICEHCHGKAGTHPCGCWAPTDRQPVCNEGDKGIRVEWPCPTERALNPEATA